MASGDVQGGCPGSERELQEWFCHAPAHDVRQFERPFVECCSGAAEQLFLQPVRDVVADERQVIALAVLCADFFGRVDAKRLVLRADRVEQLLRAGIGT